ncbi:MAG: UDP-glucose 4-epimerase [Candidatus Shapirobacteria bacterium GW2011_GWE1_38_10]|uniref:UDP-glucose 4-epimerase n=1 Tax=Candidatus Shapirobacteria bacterium GW2011_GWE1_38_10 TaxID=1618488 RepID=A0A0G0KLJ6_9BACT|nr:MAG: UDP-glucose 4-epimerase [Candidatus Shapirobacteria bacterium GW2011_GWF2_37_20]KKQ50059.1 MAG: UDP-glucose 4-epimerase [Candidatus Shapirobacteria bacterium GW2011_GWE1_38_10]KKQ64548.1 MAG: UDP-glucose 4-epimerase [Candidatus Shapirobacteria bacterium GW2011_GWF1_38_23]HBP51131.1 UDP-glucose 4-epimerase GalE [Candidatus Shapirobacteria bacterium]
MILIVGGAGYIGSEINKELNEAGFQTVVFDSLVSGHKEATKWGEFVQGDLNNLEDIRGVFKKYKIEAVFDFAAFIEVGESVKDPQKYYFNNLVNTLNLLKVMKEFEVNKIIFSSTAATFGEPKYTPIDEVHPQWPINPYGWTKLMIERVFADYDVAYGLRYVALRYFNACGANDEADIGEDHAQESHLIPLILDAAIGKRENIKIFGTDYPTPDGTCVRDYIHVVDLASAHLLALKHLMDGGESKQYNLGNGKGFSVREVIDAVKKVTEKEFTVLEVERRPGDPPILIASSEKIRKELGWSPKYTEIEEIVATAWKWHQKKDDK